MRAWFDSVRRVLSGERLQHPIPPLDGALSPNDRLDSLTALEAVFEQPDDLVSDGAGGVLISAGNCLWRLDGYGARQRFAEFDGPISALARWNDGHLAVATDTGRLLRLDATGEVVAEVDASAGTPLAGITALAPDAGGGLYFAIGSTRHLAGDWVRDLMERNACGRIGYWPADGGPRVLLDGLDHPAGLCLDADGGCLLVTESWAHALRSFPLAGAGLGAPRVLIENLPGYPSRITPDASGGYWLAVFALRTQLVEFVLREKAFREDMMESLDPSLWIRPALASTGSHLEPQQIGGIKRLAISKPWAPPRSYGLVLHIDADGEIMDSMHSRVSGRYHGITAVRTGDNLAYIVSRGAGRILTMPARVDASGED